MLIGKPKSQAGIRTGNVTRSYRRKSSHGTEELEKIVHTISSVVI